MVSVDGVEYYKVLKSIYFDDDTQYAHIEQPAEPAFNRIEDNDHDTWHRASDGSDRWDMDHEPRTADGGYPRAYILQRYKTYREYTV